MHFPTDFFFMQADAVSFSRDYNISNNKAFTTKSSPTKKTFKDIFTRVTSWSSSHKHTERCPVVSRSQLGPAAGKHSQAECNKSDAALASVAEQRRSDTQVGADLEETYLNSFLCGSRTFSIFSAYSFFAHV